MANVYRQFNGQLDALQHTNFELGPAHVQMRMTPAGRLMIARNPRNFTQLFQAYVTAYQGLWSWNPGPKTPQGAEVCDGVGMFGQCAAFARGLHFLARCPKPYGLALGAHDVEVVRYNGALSQGFISPHDGIHFGLAANVLRPGTAHAPEIEPLYYWDNHYVVKYLGRHFDPSYNLEYGDLSEMATYEIEPGTVQHDGDTYEVASHVGRKYYFKVLDNLIHGGRRIPVEGPFDRLP